jgi:hypothetical protein
MFIGEPRNITEERHLMNISPSGRQGRRTKGYIHRSRDTEEYKLLCSSGN